MTVILQRNDLIMDNAQPYDVVLEMGNGTVIVEYTEDTIKKTHVWRSIYGGPGYFENSEFSIKCLKRERLIYESLPLHPGILTFYGCIPFEGDGGAAAIQLERAHYGNLRRLLETVVSSTLSNTSNPSYPPDIIEIAQLPDTRWKWVMQLVSALKHLHTHSFIHCDISCRNILLTTSLHAKLADFGGSAILGENGYVSEEGRYACPVHLQKQDGDGRLPTIRTDIFALGSAIYEIIIGYPPYADVSTDEAEAFYKVEKWPSVVGVDTGDIILRCWKGEYKSVQDVEFDLKVMNSARGTNGVVALAS
jgi:hypothetical protein